jgi:hypothetical protein
VYGSKEPETKEARDESRLYTNRVRYLCGLGRKQKKDVGNVYESSGIYPIFEHAAQGRASGELCPQALPGSEDCLCL